MKPDVLIGESKEMEVPFMVGSAINPQESDEILTPDNVDGNFLGDSSLASLLFGWGIVRMLVNAGKQAILLVRDFDHTEFPDGTMK